MGTIEAGQLSGIKELGGLEERSETGGPGRNPVLSATGAPEQEEVERAIYKLQFRIDVSRRYMLRRRDFLEAAAKLCTFLNVFGGSAAFASILLQQQGLLGAGAALGVALVGLIDMVYRFEHGAQRHDAQYRRYTSLQLDMTRNSPRDMTAIAGFEARYLEIEIEDPYPRQVLMQITHNDALSVRNQADERIRIFFLRRWLAHFMDLPPGEWKRAKSKVG